MRVVIEINCWNSNSASFNSAYFNLGSPEQLSPNNQSEKGFAHLWLILFQLCSSFSWSYFLSAQFPKETNLFPPSVVFYLLILAEFRKPSQINCFVLTFSLKSYRWLVFWIHTLFLLILFFIHPWLKCLDQKLLSNSGYVDFPKFYSLFLWVFVESSFQVNSSVQLWIIFSVLSVILFIVAL